MSEINGHNTVIHAKSWADQVLRNGATVSWQLHRNYLHRPQDATTRTSREPHSAGLHASIFSHRPLVHIIHIIISQKILPKVGERILWRNAHVSLCSTHAAALWRQAGPCVGVVYTQRSYITCCACAVQGVGNYWSADRKCCTFVEVPKMRLGFGFFLQTV